MNAPVSVARRLAVALMRHLDLVLPTSRLEWAEAMRAELDHLESDRDALAWAIGCLVAGSKERINIMLTGNLRISRWILVPEMLLCFVPLTFGWLVAIGGSSGIARLSGDVIQRRFLQAPEGTLTLFALIAAAVLGAFGPLQPRHRLSLAGLGSHARQPLVPRGVGRRSRCLWHSDAGHPVGDRGHGRVGFRCCGHGFDFWSGILLLSVLPSLGAAHMLDGMRQYQHAE